MAIVCVIDADAVDAILDRALAESDHHKLPATALAPHAQQMAQLVADLLPGLAAEIDAGGFSGESSSSLTSIAASLEHIVHALEEAEVSSAVTRSAKEVIDAAVSAGHGADSPTRLAEFLSRDRASGHPPTRHTDRDAVGQADRSPSAGDRLL
ncbi:hypothetical protein [Streptosporangium roseum]|uniref:imine reductase family protein n=1 Tax=Streptosporangium roseum TaxID=2001 RepID=UPI00331CC3B2